MIVLPKEGQDLTGFARDIRVQTLRQFHRRGFGHVGGSLSIVETLAVLYGAVMRIDPSNPRLEGRDQLVMSKGHAGPALYAALALKGYFPLDLLDTLNQNGTSLPSHCDRKKTPGIDMTTGSLGQGISSALGIALAGRLKNDGSYCYLILGDGECDEGQVWESALFAAHHKVSNLIAFVDRNHKQLDGTTEEICDLGDLRAKFEQFGWYSQEVDGHIPSQIFDAIKKAHAQAEKPAMIILNTIKGKGAAFAENTRANHHMVCSREEVQSAIDILSGKGV